jgi:hypothetical protein
MALHIDCVEPDDLLGSGKIPGTPFSGANGQRFGEWASDATASRNP